MIEDQTGSEPGAFVDTYVPEDREDGAVDHREGASGGPKEVVIVAIRVDDPLRKILEGGKGLPGD